MTAGPQSQWAGRFALAFGKCSCNATDAGWLRQKLQPPDATATLQVAAGEPTVQEARVNWERSSGKLGRLGCDLFIENVFPSSISSEIQEPQPSGFVAFQSRPFP